MVGILVSFWDALFSGAMLVSGSVIITQKNKCQQTTTSFNRMCQHMSTYFQHVPRHLQSPSSSIPNLDPLKPEVFPDWKKLGGIRSWRSGAVYKGTMFVFIFKNHHIMAGQPTPPGHVPPPEIAGLIKGLLTIGFP